jgi:ribosomal protein S18 acetylase RimI-like enzyme
MRPPRREDAPFIAELYSRDWPEPMPVDRVRRQLKDPTLHPEDDARVTDTAFVMLLREGERASLRLAGEVTPELLAWAEGRAREAGVARLLAATWNVGGATAQLLESSGYSPKAFSMRMRIELEGRAFSPRVPDGIAVRTFREGDAERVYRTHLETFQDVSEPMRATFEEWSHALLQPLFFHPYLWFLAEDGDELAGIALCDPHPTAVRIGHVSVLGVRAPWRGRGLGLALLEHAFAAFAARGFSAVILGAEADSPTGANRLYERAGMRMTHRRARYQKLLA